ncbi:ATP-binding protein [Rhizobacter sp. Root1221]|uniref:sensor histidine kinase n=1 Tax=Rhizobacter sp. Root1221 TaxID=1736433 RepID=UPI0006FBABF4|nr:ATP-binding protein [Rhizobacter sp. Root1221]KQV78883.1 histidine kinase [Rhizobacter sp. Root1221]
MPSSEQHRPIAATAPLRRPMPWHGFPRWCAALGLMLVVAYFGHQVALQAGLMRLREAAAHRLDMLATGLEADLSRFDYLPALLEVTPVVPDLLESPADHQLRDAANRYLGGVSATAGAEMLFVLDAAGTSLAASDWQEAGTTIGQDLSFRPYVIDAVQQGRGRFYGVGITSRRPGYYLSYALRRGNLLRGVVAVKVSIEDAERAWRNLPGDVMLIDERGVVILSTRGDLKYRPVAPLQDSQRAEVQRSRPYGEATLEPLDWVALKAPANEVHQVVLDGRLHLASTRLLQHTPWRLVVLDDLAPVQAMARYAAVTASLAMAVLVLVGVTLWQRQRAMRHKLASQAALQAAHDSLESTVAARTAELRAAQADLIHASKLAALGQMSAGMVHELNQPLTAMRTLSESAGILLDQDRPEEVRGNLRRIAGLVDRLARLTSQLKTFAHKSDAPVAAVALARCIADAQALVGSELQARDIVVEVDVQPPGLSLLADEATMGSLLINLFRNAIDAMQGAPQRMLSIRARASGGRVSLTVCDSGPGIRADILARLFEPFVTSKPAGAGLGLGLVISAQLVRGAGGSLQAANRAEGGACFTVDLPGGIPKE